MNEPLAEEEVLAVTTENVEADLILEYMETKAQCCVDHLCGCK
ncbi:MAG: hypothetical protein Q8L56_02420 [Rhodocyclaceae bacterium]|nr:hypothetical protein [Rhodocyclaceae bacterium]